MFVLISIKINELIEKERSSQNIKKLREISLLVLARIIRFYRKEGYSELALAIGVALVEFNLFVPQRVYLKYSRQDQVEQKKNEFRKYWEQYQEERIGDLKWGERRGWEGSDKEQEIKEENRNKEERNFQKEKEIREEKENKEKVVEGISSVEDNTLFEGNTVMVQ